MALGGRPMDDWEAMTVAKSVFPEQIFDELCLRWQQKILTSWSDAFQEGREIPENELNGWVEKLSAGSETLGSKSILRELPQPPVWLRSPEPFRR